MSIDLDSMPSCLQACGQLVAAGSFAPVFQLADLRQARHRDGALLYYTALYGLCRAFDARRTALARRLILATPAGGLCSPVALFFDGLLDAHDGAVTAAAGKLRRARDMARATPQHYDFDQSVGWIFRAPDLVLAPDQPPAPPILTELHGAEAAAAGEAPCVVAASCDMAYLRRFGRGLVDSLAARGLPGHLHVSGRDAAVQAAGLIAEWRALPGVRLGASFDPPAFDAAALSPNVPVYYAGNRFLKARALLDLYRRDLMVMDVDQVFTGDLDALRRAMAGKDFGCFFEADFEPWLRTRAGLTWFADTEPARRLLRLMESLLAAGLPASVWCLDQGALFCAQSHLAMGEGSLAAARLDQASGRSLWDFIAIQGETAERQAIRGETAARGRQGPSR